MSRDDKALLARLALEALEIQAEEARAAGSVGYVTRALVQATMPHKKPALLPVINPMTGEPIRDRDGKPMRTEERRHVRRNGQFELSMTALDGPGLPYGTVPRLEMAWIATEAVKTKSRELALGDSLSAFLRELGYQVTGGKKGDITRVREQTVRLLSTAISCSYGDTPAGHVGARHYLIADGYDLWWDPKSIDQGSLFESKITLSERFYRELIEHPVPVDLRILRALKGSSMSLDIYCWLTHRISYLRQPTAVPWAALAVQFGSDFAALADFRKAFRHHLRQVITVWPEARLAISGETTEALTLKPARPSVSRRIAPG